MRPWILAETTYTHTRDHQYEVAVLPLGATEPHNLHLPYGTDTFAGEVIGREICAAAHQRGAKVVLLPAIAYGTETNMRRLPLALNVNPTTLFQFVTDLVESLVNSNIRKILLLNSHGGNDMKPLLRELAGKLSAHLFLCTWHKAMADENPKIFSQAEDHAGEMETSMALAYFPELVLHRPDGSLAADSGQTATTRFRAVNEGWVAITRAWHLLTTNAGAGNPHAATADKGRRLMEVLVDRLATFLVELSEAKLDERFPF